MALFTRYSAPVSGHQHTITLSEIISSYDLGLTLLTGHDADVADTPVQWVHTSELVDPTPFLTRRTVLLTTGSQLPVDIDADAAGDYVGRLVDAGVSALGFGVEISHDRIPHVLFTACEEASLPLFRVPYDTPFIAITQHATRQLAAMSFERERWSLDTQRAISRAALRRLGLTAAVDELATRLDRWIMLTNARGMRLHTSERAPDEGDTPTWVVDAIQSVASRGVQANVTRRHEDEQVHLQTIGGRAGVQGILVVQSTDPLDHAEHSAIEQVATLAALHLEQHRQLSSGRSQLKSAVLTLLLRGEVDAAADVSQAFEHRLPEHEMYLLYLGDTSSLTVDRFEQVQAFASQLPEVLLGMHDEELLLITPPRHRTRIIQFCESLDIPAGLSRKHDLASIVVALDEAHSAWRFAKIDRSPQMVHAFEATMNEGVTALLRDNSAAQDRAVKLLQPVIEHDRRHGDALTATLTVWLTHHGHNSQTADALGVHRHTVANRMKLIGELLGRDLYDAHDRAELIVALTLVDAGGMDPSR